MRVARAGELLSAPGILQNDVPAEALWDAGAADAHTLRNLLQRSGYDGMSALREEGRDEGRLEQAKVSLRRLLARRQLALSPEQDARIGACTSLETLEHWLDGAVDAASTDAALESSRDPAIE